MTVVRTPSRAELEQARAAILNDLGMSRDELREVARSGALVGEQWSAWSDLRDLDFLLDDENGEDADEA